MRKRDNAFQKRLSRHHDELKWLYMELYGNESMFAELTSQMYEYYQNRKAGMIKEKKIQTGLRKMICLG